MAEKGVAHKMKPDDAIMRMVWKLLLDPQWQLIWRGFQVTKTLSMRRLPEDEEKIVAVLSAAQREKLRENAHKAHWTEDSLTVLFGKLLEEVRELGLEISTNRGKDRAKKVLREAADVANFAAMIADVVAREKMHGEVS